MSKYILGGNIEDGKVYVRSSNDEGINLDNSILIYFYPNLICSIVVFFKLQKNDIINSYRLIGNISSDNLEIKYINSSIKIYTKIK